MNNMEAQQHIPQKSILKEKLTSREVLLLEAKSLLMQYSKDPQVTARLEHTVTCCEVLGFKPTDFSAEQIARLTLCNMIDPLGTEKNRFNTHFEDAFQMALVASKAYEVIADKVGGISVSKEVFAFMFLNHDIGKGGEAKSDIYAKLFSIKDENAYIRKTLKDVDRSTLPTALQDFLQKPHALDTRNIVINDALIGFGLHTPENIAALEAEGFTLEQPFKDIFHSHEKKLATLQATLATHSKFTAKEKGLILLGARGHHLDRFQLEAQKLDAPTRKLLIVMDIIDKAQAFLTRPSTTGTNPTQILYHTQPEKLGEPLSSEYKMVIQHLLGEHTKNIADTWLGHILLTLNKREYM